jgi:hypothetical protein
LTVFLKILLKTQKVFFHILRTILLTSNKFLAGRLGSKTEEKKHRKSSFTKELKHSTVAPLRISAEW